MFRVLNARFPIAIGFCLILPHSGYAQSVTVSSATIDSGKLVVEGTTASPSALVELDDTFQRTSNASGQFRFELQHYHPGDCVVDVASGGDEVKAVVANCSVGFRHRGQWQATRTYNANDVVLHLARGARSSAARVSSRLAIRATGF